MDFETKSELMVIFREKRDKARIRKNDLQNKLEELRAESAKIEEEIKKLDSATVSVGR